MNKRLIFTVCACSLSGLLFGYDIGAIAGASPSVRIYFHLLPAAFGIAISSVIFGTIAGSIGAGFLSDALGRRKTLSISALTYSVAAVISTLSCRFTQFVLSRLLCGIAIGLISVVAPMYLAEVAPSKLRGRIVGLFQMSLSIGVVAGFLAGYFISSLLHSQKAWRLLLVGGVIPALLSLLCLSFSVDSPRWLALRGRSAELHSSLACLGINQLEFDTTTIPDTSKKHNEMSLFSHQLIRPVMLAISIAMFNQLTGVNAILYYVLDIFRNLGAGRLNGRVDALILSILSLCVTILALFLIDKIGRKPLLLAGTIGMCICLFLLPAIRWNNWPASTVVVVLACYEACFGFSQGTVIWIYLSEIFPLPLRARGQSLGTTMHWITNAVVVSVFPVLSSHFGGRVFIGLALIMIFQCLVIFLFYPETKNRSLESLAFENNA